MPRTINAPKASMKPTTLKGKDSNTSSGKMKISKQGKRAEKSSSSKVSKSKKGLSARRPLPGNAKPKTRKTSRRVSLARKIKKVQKHEYKLGRKGYIPRSPMTAEIRELMQEHGSSNMKLAKQAALMIQLGAEFKVKQILNKAKYLTVNAKRKTMTSNDLLTHLMVCEPEFFQRHSETLMPTMD